MHKNTWSPLRDALTNSDTSLCLAEIIKHTLIQSDNNCTDLLLKTIGGVKTVQAYLKQIGLPNIEVNNTEWEMFQSPNLIYSNKATPSDITSLLNKLYNQKLFSDSCFNFLWKTLSDCSTGNNRIKGRLPKETEVAHKTGTSFTTKNGITPAINDVGIITLPNGKHIALAIFVSESKENRETNERIIAEITEIIWEYATRH
jgi:beta-lactamase class A